MALPSHGPKSIKSEYERFILFIIEKLDPFKEMMVLYWYRFQIYKTNKNKIQNSILRNIANNVATHAQTPRGAAMSREDDVGG